MYLAYSMCESILNPMTRSFILCIQRQDKSAGSKTIHRKEETTANSVSVVYLVPGTMLDILLLLNINLVIYQIRRM